MRLVEFKFCVDVSDQKEIAALNKILILMGENFKADVRKLPEGKELTSEKPAPVIILEAKDEPTPKSEKPAEEKPKKSGVKVEDIRAVLSSKIDANRPTIKAKLTELGTNNVTNLPEEHYEDFMQFLNSLA